MHCLFCRSEGPFTIEHVIPESLGNDDLVLEGIVCGGCNSHFSKLEAFVLQKSPIAFWRAFLGIRTKRGELPSVDLSQPRSEKGVFPTTHPAHDNNVGFTAHEDLSTSVDIDDIQKLRAIANGARTSFRFVMTPKVLFVFGRFLCKVGVELLCVADENRARDEGFERARRFARFGDFVGLWPIFHFDEGDIDGFRHIRLDKDGPFEDVDCYSYRLIDINRRYTVAQLRVGTDNWVVCLNEPFPDTEIRSAFPGHELKCIWYSPEEWTNA